jgi:septum formation protein
MRKIVLASQSPRRRELLALMGVVFDVIPSNFDEKLDESRTPDEVAIELAVGKASTVAEQYPDCIVIGSDTIVTIDGNQLEKPRDKAEAHQMLKRYGGTYNRVTSSVAVMCKEDGVLLTGSDNADVYFKSYDEAMVRAYVETGDSLDKAGGYGIQSGAAPLIDHIEGNYDTVMGLPTKLLANLLSQLGIKARSVKVELPAKQAPR